LLDKVARGEKFVITRRGWPVAKLVPVKPQSDRERRSREAGRRLRVHARKFGGKFNWDEWKKYRDADRP
jgi:prevent-host-death family protein